MKINYLQLLLCFVFSVTTLNSFAQVGIGTSDPKAALDIEAIDNGLLIPRVSLTGTDDTTTMVGGNVTSILVYNKDTTNDVIPGYYYWSGTKWENLVTNSKITYESIWLNNPTKGRTELRTLSDGVTERGIDNNVYITDSSNLLIDALVGDETNGNSRKIQVHNGDIAKYTYLDNPASFGYLGFKSRGTQAAPTSVNAGGVITSLHGLGYNGTEYVSTSLLSLGIDPSYDNSSSLIPGDFRFITNLDGDSSEKVRINALGQIGIGTNSPTEMLEIHGTNLKNGDADFDVHCYGSNITSFHIRSAAGTKNSPLAVSNKSNFNFYNMEAQGYDGSGYKNAAAIRMGVMNTNLTGPNDMPGRIDFATSPDGSASTQVRMRIDDQGNIGIGTGSGAISEKLVVDGKIKATSVNFSGLPTFADESAATSGGLTTGDLYQTSTGALRIKQ